VLHQRHLTQGIPWHTRLLANYHVFCALASRAPAWSNALLRSAFLHRQLHLPAGRTLPLLALQTFSTWMRKRRPPAQEPVNGEVVLLLDPNTEYFEPEIGQAAVELLEHLGFRFRITPCLSTGRLPISLGLLDQARTTLLRTLARLDRVAPEPIRIIGLEPAEILTLRDEAPAILPKSATRERSCAARGLTFEEFLLQIESPPALAVHHAVEPVPPVQVHLHCHERSLVGPDSTALLFDTYLPNDAIEILNTGCCGMAGTFGYIEENYELSRKIAELGLLPKIQAAPSETVTVANGASCRRQLLDLAGKRALHTAQLLRDRLCRPPNALQ
jgi:Fe-S oxidoreductase